MKLIAFNLSFSFYFFFLGFVFIIKWKWKSERNWVYFRLPFFKPKFLSSVLSLLVRIMVCCLLLLLGYFLSCSLFAQFNYLFFIIDENWVHHSWTYIPLSLYNWFGCVEILTAWHVDYFFVCGFLVFDGMHLDKFCDDFLFLFFGILFPSMLINCRTGVNTTKVLKNNSWQWLCPQCQGCWDLLLLRYLYLFFHYSI